MGEDFTDSILGAFKAGKYGYDGKIDFNGKPVRISLDDKEGIKTAQAVQKELSSLLPEASAFAAEELTELANEWLEDDAEEITEEDFIERISLSEISILKNGRYVLWFKDGRMFHNHAVCVYGSIDGHFETAVVEG